MDMPRIVLDTNVLVAGLMSRRGASFRLLSCIDKGIFNLCVSVPLVVEYEDVLKREAIPLPLSLQDIEAVLNYLCKIAEHRQIHYLWRRVLKDPKDDIVLELALESQCKYIVTYNLRDFKQAVMFGIEALPPAEFLKKIGEI